MSPRAKLDVNGTVLAKSPSAISNVWLGYNDGTQDYGIYQWQNAGAPPVNYFQNKIGVGTTTPNASLDIYDQSGYSDVIFPLKISNNTGPNGTVKTIFAVAESGKVSMGYEVVTQNVPNVPVAGRVYCPGGKHVLSGTCLIPLGTPDGPYFLQNTDTDGTYYQCMYNQANGSQPAITIQTQVICANLH